MNKTSTGSLPLATAFGLVLAASASASTFSVSGAGGAIPDTAVVPGTWNSTYTGTPFTSTVTVPRNVTSITKVQLAGFTHTWRGDLHIILRSPAAGPSWNLVVRPGSTGLSVGDSGDYLSGTYDFVPAPATSVHPGPDATPSATSIGGGTYQQFNNSGSGAWTTGGITNGDLSTIAGPAGTWTLEIRDWAAADIGSLTGWTLEGNDVSGGFGTSFCGGAALAGLCPCGDPTNPGAGCDNVQNTGGATLTGVLLGAATQAVVADDLIAPTVQLNLAQANANVSLCAFIQGTTSFAPTASFDGRLCVGTFIRLNLQPGTVGPHDAIDGTGTNMYPHPGSTHDQSITQQSVTLGAPISAGETRHYQVAYRDPPGCLGGGEVNWSNAFSIVWN